MLLSKIRWRMLGGLSLVLVCVVVAERGYAHEGHHGGTPQTPPLALLVQEFLIEKDSDQATTLAHAIVTHPDASIQMVTNLIQAGRTYGPQPVGMQANMPVHVRGVTQRYGLYVPPTYSPSEPFPLVVCLHGAGFTGDSYLERWEPRLGNKFILACPSEFQGAWWTRFAEELVLATIEEIRSRYRIDPDRIFLTGMSNGGIGAWIIGMHHAPTFAGIAPMASGLDDVLFPFLENLRHTPVYIIHGVYDQVMPVELSRDIVQELTKIGVEYIYREHELKHPHAGGHFFPREELPALVSWFGAQIRKSLPRTITVVRDATHLTRFNWVRIDATDHIAAFTENLIDYRDELIAGRKYARVDAEVKADNLITVRTQRVRRYTLFFNDHLIDFSKPITVETNGNISFQGKVTPNLEILLHEARFRQDPGQVFSAQVTVDVP